MVVVVMGGGLSVALWQREERRQADAVSTVVWQQDQLIEEHRQERRHGPGRRSKGSGSSSGFKTALIAMDRGSCTHSAVHPP
jgi:hypothetical protein